MNKGLNIFLVILLCVVLYIGLLMSFYSSDNSDSWNPQQGYTMPMGGKSSTSAVSVGVGSTSTGVSVPMRSSSRSMRSSRAVSLYAPAQHLSVANTQYPIGGTPSNSVASPLYTTSSATMKSFGGGSNGAVSVSGGAVQSSSRGASQVSSFLSYGNGVGVNPSLAMSSSHSSLGTFPLGNMHGANFLSLGDSHVDVSYGYQGIGNTTNTAPLGIGGRLNAGPSNSSYYAWLRWLAEHGDDYDIVDENGYCDEEGHYHFDKNAAEEAYYAWFEYAYNMKYEEYVANGGYGSPAVTFEQWLSWFTSYNGTHTYGGNTYHYLTPVGDCISLLVLAIMYLLLLFCKSMNNKRCQSV